MAVTVPHHLRPLEEEEQFDFLFKIVLIGDAGVGKTCVVQRFKTGTFLERQGNTIGVDFTMKTVHLDGKKIKVLPVPLTGSIILVKCPLIHPFGILITY